MGILTKFYNGGEQPSLTSIGKLSSTHLREHVDRHRAERVFDQPG